MTGNDVDKRSLELLRAANRLAAHSFEDWNAFVGAFSLYAEIPMVQLLRTTTGGDLSLSHVQGRARMAHELAEMFMKCREQLQALENKLASQQRLQQPRKGSI